MSETVEKGRVVLSMEAVSKEFLPPAPMHVRRMFARLGGLQIDEGALDPFATGVEDDDDDFDLEGDIPDEERLPEPTARGRAIFRDVSFRARAGTVVVVSGPPGSGKTTLLKLASGITPPSSGRVVVRGTVAPALDVMATVLPSRGHDVRTALPQLGAMVGIPARLVRDAFDAIVEIVGDSSILRAYTSYMDGARKRELVLAMALAVEPDILVSDYSFRPDDEFTQRCAERAAELRERGTLLVLESEKPGKLKVLVPPAHVLTLHDGRVESSFWERPVNPPD